MDFGFDLSFGFCHLDFPLRGVGLTVPHKKGAPNLVPAGAVIREPQALPGFIGRKASAGGVVRLLLNLRAQP
ncbi:MAG: hypothetical protein A3I08_00140 [Candidatus Andersenbacteria bacterium RIFCSPLOWO2_02_FULL_46_11]|nr:MAG: hypothetical protein A3B76_00735 [Candidatus Andersenbacteria bacterium RIFCSPHIGHO2_02_FULL_46_16]OGY37439.1 MAG: hypothetical protein A3I08_00140 [Candidatus Andersenbacteria bacterium RIFCSPLOWO2_02_FULL_46_11]